MGKKIVERIFTRELLEHLDIPNACTDTEMVHTGRWALHYTGVFEYEGAHWMIGWQEGATEDQYDIDIWDDEIEISAMQVVKVPVVKYEWVAKVNE